MDPREALAHDAEQQRQRILRMEPGPELNALVAEQVFGEADVHRGLDQDGVIRLYVSRPCSFGALAPLHTWMGQECRSCRVPVPPYSTEAGAAWLVVERLREMRYLQYICPDPERDGWGVAVAWPTALTEIGVNKACGAGICATSLPLAVCRAALLAVSETQPR